MTHLGADIAAYVDGQLSESATRAVDAHLQTCQACESAVVQQRIVKARMSAGRAPEVPPSLFASLTQLPAEQPEPDPWWVRLTHAAPATIALALAGASLAVVSVAYVVGGIDRGDQIRPGFEAFVSDFFGATPGSTAASFSSVSPESLDEQGWPCHESMGQLQRSSSGLDRAEGVVVVNYTDGLNRLKLYQQAGRLDRESVAGFTQQSVGDATVWVRSDEPTILTWDRDGIVYTIVTDLDVSDLADALADLPTGIEPGPLRRIGDGIDRMADWATAA